MNLQHFINYKIYERYGSSLRKSKLLPLNNMTLEAAVKIIKADLEAKKKTIEIKVSPFIYCFLWASQQVIYGYACFWFKGLKFVPDPGISYESDNLILS